MPECLRDPQFPCVFCGRLLREPQSIDVHKDGVRQPIWCCSVSEYEKAHQDEMLGPGAAIARAMSAAPPLTGW